MFSFGKSVKMLWGLFVSLMILAGNASAEPGVLTIAILPCKDIVLAFKEFHLLAEHIEEKTGMDIKLVVPEDSTIFEKGLRNGDINFAFQDPYTYIRLSHLYNQKFLLKGLNREGGTLQSGVVITRKDNGISKVADLKGKTVMFGPELSANTWIFAKLLFEENSINLDEDLRDYSHGKCCEDIAFNVYLKIVDAGVVCDHFVEEHADKQRELGIAAKEIIVIGQTEMIPMNVFAANRSLNEDLIRTVNEALLSLDKEKSAHAKILFPSELGGFKTTKDEDYNGLRMLINRKVAK